MRRKISTALLILVCFLIQTSILPAVAFGSIIPNLLIILTASCGFMNGEKTGMIIGFICGLLADIFGGEAIGFYTLLYMYVGYVNGLFERLFYPEDIKLPMILILFSDIGYNFICYVFLFLLRGRFQFGYYFIHLIVPEAVYTILLTFIVYPLLLAIHKKLEAYERRSTN